MKGVAIQLGSDLEIDLLRLMRVHADCPRSLSQGDSVIDRA